MEKVNESVRKNGVRLAFIRFALGVGAVIVVELASQYVLTDTPETVRV